MFAAMNPKQRGRVYAMLFISYIIFVSAGGFFSNATFCFSPF